MDPALITSGAVTAFLEILFIDIVLAGDNAIVVGALAAGLPAEQRKKVILIGVCISVPAIAGYTVFSYRVFRGKTGELRYA